MWRFYCRAIITESDVHEIFRLSSGGMSQAEIARRYGYKSSVSILQILRRERLGPCQNRLTVVLFPYESAWFSRHTHRGGA